MSRTLIASDNFNVAALSGNWQQLDSGFGGDVTIYTSTVIGGSNFGGNAVARWVGAGSFTADQYSKIAIDTVVGSDNYGLGVIARASADTTTTRDYYYLLWYSAGSPNLELGKIVNGTQTILFSGDVSFTTSDTIELECEGTTIRAMKNGVALGGSWTVTDASLASGAPGVLGRGDLGQGDNWEGGNITASVAHGGALVMLQRRKNILLQRFGRR